MKILLLICLLGAVWWQTTNGGTIDRVRYGLTFGKSLHLAKYNIDGVGCAEFGNSRVNPEIAYYSFINLRMDAPYSIASLFKRCNTITGDTTCEKSLPILCMKRQFVHPTPSVPINYALGDSFARQWTDANFATTPAIKGTELRSGANMNSLCEYYLGSLWRAVYNDNVNGSAWYGFGNIRTDLNYWIYHLNQPPQPNQNNRTIQRANCWDP